MPPKRKPKPLSTAQIEAMLGGDSDSEDDNIDEIFGPGVDLEDDIPQDEALASGAGAGAGAGDGDDIEDNVESKYSILSIQLL